jgi:hypothetical protein
VWDASCQCAGQLIDCIGTIGGSALPGSSCDDGDLSTGADKWGSDCVCAGLPYDCVGVPGGPALPGTLCNDGLAERWAILGCQLQLCGGSTPPIDCTGTPGGTALPGTVLR